MRDHTPVTTSDFLGLYDRGTDDVVPHGHQSTCNNMQFFDGEIQSRYGTGLNYTGITNVKQIELYKRPGEVTRLLILNASGQLYDSTEIGTPILTVSGMTGFRVENFFGRAYITPVNISDGVGVSGSYIYVYDGTGTARVAAGSAPTGTLTIAASALSGIVEAGYHLYAVAYETESGFITKPGPAIYAILESDGTRKVDLSGIPTGPVGTAKRHILATKAIIVFDGNQNAHEFFFVPNGTLNDNITDTITVDFYDADLIESAEYLFDQYEAIPACAGLAEYKGRLVGWNENYIFVSKAGEPESIDALTGLVLIAPGEAGYITDCIEYRDIFYVHKKFRVTAVADNGGDPSTWATVALDKGLGSPIRGIIKILDAEGASIDKFLVASTRGLVLFNGLYQEPELSWKIEHIWQRINKNYFHFVHGVNDTSNHRLYIAVPLDEATSCSHIIYGDYSNGLDATNIRWSLWSSSVWNPTSILIDLQPISILGKDSTYLRIGSTAGVYDLDTASRLDVAAAISSTLKTNLISPHNGYLSHYGSLRLRISGSGTLLTNLYTEDSSTVSALANTTLAASPNYDVTLLSNVINEKCMIELKTTAANAWFSVRRIDLFAKTLWSGRPL